MEITGQAVACGRTKRPGILQPAPGRGQKRAALGGVSAPAAVSVTYPAPAFL